MAATAQHLRVLIANEGEERLRVIGPIVTSLGHEVIAHQVEVGDVGNVTTAVQPDVALVGVGEDTRRALELIDQIVQEAACPVIALLDAANDDFVREAAKHGVFAYIVDDEPATWQNMMEIVLRRFAEYQSLEGAFGRRALIERAKGILMERHGIREDAAFALLRDEARRSNRRVVEMAESVVGSHAVLRLST
jgi:AmiR/NasT family two-component response regulator